MRKRMLAAGIVFIIVGSIIMVIQWRAMPRPKEFGAGIKPNLAKSVKQEKVQP